jgi:hypothetical protein
MLRAAARTMTEALKAGVNAPPPSVLSPAAVAAAAGPVTRVRIPRNGVDYRGKVVLAPMVRSGECPSRLLALKYGADLVWGMFLYDMNFTEYT